MYREDIAVGQRGAVLPVIPSLSRPDTGRLFKTDHLHADIKARSIRGGGITVAAQIAKFALQMIYTSMIARLLLPADFGIVAMVSAITVLIEALGDLGLSSATIQRAEIRHEQVSTLFWINVGFGLLISMSVAALAPGIAWFYHEPRLTAITLALSGTFILGGLTAQHYALLTRQMRFGAMALAQLLPLLASGIAGIGFAIAGWGYWALVASAITQAATTVVVVWIAAGWLPGLPRRSSGVRSMLAFGGHLTGFNLLNCLTRNGDNVLIGRFLGAGPLGTYAKAYGLLMLPVQQINAPINGVVLPALSRLQDQPEQFRRYFLRAVEALAFVGMPIIFFAFADAHEIVLTILGPRWLGAVEIFRLLAPAALVGTINSAPVWIFTSLGRTDRQLRWGAISSPIILAGFVIGLHWGATGIATSFSITFGLCFFVFVLDACRHSPINLGDFAAVLFPPLLVSAASALIVGVCGSLWHFPVLVALALHAAVFAVAFLTISLLFSGGRRFWRLLLMRAKKPKLPKNPAVIASE